MITLNNAVAVLLTDKVIVQSYIYSDCKSRNWTLQQPIQVQLSDNKRLHIGVGYTYDMATVPKWLWSFVRPYNQALLAYIIHDYLYTHRHMHSLTRKQSDAEWLLWANKINPNHFDNKFRYIFIRLFGWLWWNDYI